MPFTFSKDERLCSFKLIDQLFAEGKSFLKYPFRVVYLNVSDEMASPAQVLMSVSKKRFKRANRRNLVRRKMKEAYRIHKDELYNVLNTNGQKIVFALIYLPYEIITYDEIETGIKKVIKNFNQVLSQLNETSEQ
jgi:ribonuclease P protein component